MVKRIQEEKGLKAVHRTSTTVETSMYQQQQNTLYPKDGGFSYNNFMKLLIGSQPMIEGGSLICGKRS